MDFLSNLINTPLGYVMRFLANICQGNFAASVFLFTLLINLILLPLSIKSQKSSVQQTRIKPKLDDLKKRYGDDKQKYNEALQKLYQEENISMSGGCLPMILRLVIMLSIYSLIMSPLTYMTGVDKTQISNVTSAINSGMSDLKKQDKEKYEKINSEIRWQENGRNELSIIRLIRTDHAEETVKELLSNKEYKKIEDDLKAIIKKDDEVGIDYYLFSKKIDLTEKPDFSFDIFHKAQWLWLIPIVSFLAQILTSYISSIMQRKTNPEAPSMMGMMFFMSLFSLYLGFTFPGGVGFYWICSSIIGGAIQTCIQQFYGPHKMLARERAKELKKQYDFETTQLNKFDSQTES